MQQSADMLQTACTSFAISSPDVRYQASLIVQFLHVKHEYFYSPSFRCYHSLLRYFAIYEVDLEEHCICGILHCICGIIYH